MRAPHSTIIVLFGAPGVGKSTLAHNLGHALHIMHITGSDVIVSAYRALNPRHPALRELLRQRRYTKRNVSIHEIHRNMVKRARLTAPVFNFILKRYLTAGKPFILEGIHIFPRFLNKKYITMWATLAAPPDNVYARWLNRPKSRSRPIPFPLDIAKKMNAIHQQEARRRNVPIIREINLRKRVLMMTELLEKSLKTVHAV